MKNKDLIIYGKIEIKYKTTSNITLIRLYND